MIKKYIYIITAFLGAALLFISCGIKDSLFLKAPENLRSYNSGDDSDVYITFDAYNQEKEEGVGDYLIVGYELWYYFDNIGEAKLCDIKNPESDNSTLINLTAETSRFVSSAFTNEWIYQNVTVPVSGTMISGALTDGNSENVKVYFDDYSGTSSGTNPELVNGDTVILDLAFPNHNEYKDLSTDISYNGDFDADFKGFYTTEFYTKVANRPVNQTVYTVKFFVKAIGFESNSDRSQSGMSLESDPSNTISVDFKVTALQ